MSKFAARHVRAMTLPLIVSAGAVAPVWAQSAPAPTPAPTPNLIPGLETFSLSPGAGSTVTRPATPPPVIRTVPTPTPTPRPAPTRSATIPQPRASATPVPRVTPTPAPAVRAPVAVATPTPAPVSTPVPNEPVAPEPVAPAPAVPVPVASPVTIPAASTAVEQGGLSWPLLGGGGALVLLIGGLGFWFLQRRERFEDDEEPAAENEKHAHFDLIADRPDSPPEPALPARETTPSGFSPSSATPPAQPQAALDFGAPPKRGAHAIFDLGAVALESPTPPPASEDEAPGLLVKEEAPALIEPVPPVQAPVDTAQPAPAAVSFRATLDIELYAKRAGTNLLSAAVEYDIVVNNVGNAVAQGVQVDVRLLSAGVEQDGWIGSLFSSPIERPITPAFDLQPKGAIELSGMAMMPKEMVSVMTVQDRQLFVPVLTINLLYGWEGGTGQTATSYVVGIDRGEGAKLAPFRLDSAPRMHEGVSTLPYTVSLRR